MIDLSKNIEDLVISSDEDFDQAYQIINENQVNQYVEAPGFEQSNLKYRKIQKLIKEINNYYHNKILFGRKT